jgi:hypothetical protein
MTKSPRLIVNVDLYAQPTTDSLIENQDYSASTRIPIQKNSKKGRKRPRKRTQLKQRSAIGESSHTEEQIDDSSEDEDDENAEIY